MNAFESLYISLDNLIREKRTESEYWEEVILVWKKIQRQEELKRTISIVIDKKILKKLKEMK